MSVPIQCNGLCHSYGRYEVFRDMSFSVDRGRVLGLLGRNGAGKTTTINILMGFLRPTAGECRIFGEPSHDIRPETRRQIGLLHEGHLQYEFMNIQQAERFHSGFYPKWKREVFYDLVDRMGLSHTHRISRMSCGQRSQVVLGLVLAQDPELIILDDYSMGLDAGYRRLFLDYLLYHVKNAGTTVLVTSHIVQDLERLVDDIIILDRHGVLVQSPLSEFATSFRRYDFDVGDAPATVPLGRDQVVSNFDRVGDVVSVYSFDELDRVREHVRQAGMDFKGVEDVPMSLEDAFIGMTGKY